MTDKKEDTPVEEEPKPEEKDDKDKDTPKEGKKYDGGPIPK